jgi:hypothetical protein
MTAEPHPGLERRVDSLVRRHGLAVQNRASRGEGERIHLAFMISPGSDEQARDVQAAVNGLARVEESLCLGAIE